MQSIRQILAEKASKEQEAKKQRDRLAIKQAEEAKARPKGPSSKEREKIAIQRLQRKLISVLDGCANDKKPIIYSRFKNNLRTNFAGYSKNPSWEITVATTGENPTFHIYHHETKKQYDKIPIRRGSLQHDTYKLKYRGKITKTHEIGKYLSEEDTLKKIRDYALQCQYAPTPLSATFGKFAYEYSLKPTAEFAIWSGKKLVKNFESVMWLSLYATIAALTYLNKDEETHHTPQEQQESIDPSKEEPIQPTQIELQMLTYPLPKHPPSP